MADLQTDYDVVIAGGGLVGASLACALQELSWRVAVIESVPFRSSAAPGYDDRSIALAYGSRRIFEALGMWDELKSRVAPIEKIHITDRGHFGAARLNSIDEGVEALGYVAETRVLGKVVMERLQQGSVELLCPATIEALEQDESRVRLTLRENETERQVSCRLLVAADGANSFVREALGIEVTRWDYGQTAVIANVSLDRPHKQVAHERFTESGPLALLPMRDDEQGRARCSLVWTTKNTETEEILGLDDEAFLQRLQERFGQRLGRFVDVGARHAYPLQLVRAKASFRGRVALMGNAAHTLHPIAGQGFNLGIRDVAVLAELLADADDRQSDPGVKHLLQAYADWRKRDHLKVIAFTDALARLFANPLLPVRLLRNLGLVGLDLVPTLKHILTRQTMGVSGRLPRLGRGLPVTIDKAAGGGG